MRVSISVSDVQRLGMREACKVLQAQQDEFVKDMMLNEIFAAAERARFVIDGKPKERKPQPRNRAARRRAASLGRC